MSNFYAAYLIDDSVTDQRGMCIYKV